MVSSSLSDPSACASTVLERGFVHVRLGRLDSARVWAGEIFAATSGVDAIGVDMPPLEVVGEFTVPPPGAVRRDFQTLHIDFGLPIDGRDAIDVARFTALHIAPDHPTTTARTRVVPLHALLSQRVWPDRASLLGRLRKYGATQAGKAGYIEGILGRIVEAADDCSVLPSTSDPGFLCGTEFASIAAERAHFTRHSLELDLAEQRIPLRSGELLVFDNLATAHGRVGTRRPGELHQLCVGYRGLAVAGQETLLHRVLDAFGSAEQ